MAKRTRRGRITENRAYSLLFALECIIDTITSYG
jgi:hypothetical protein